MVCTNQHDEVERENNSNEEHVVVNHQRENSETQVATGKNGENNIFNRHNAWIRNSVDSSRNKRKDGSSGGQVHGNQRSFESYDRFVNNVLRCSFESIADATSRRILRLQRSDPKANLWNFKSAGVARRPFHVDWLVELTARTAINEHLAISYVRH